LKHAVIHTLLIKVIANDFLAAVTGRRLISSGGRRAVGHEVFNRRNVLHIPLLRPHSISM
jgi:hypothetical protein